MSAKDGHRQSFALPFNQLPSRAAQGAIMRLVMALVLGALAACAAASSPSTRWDQLASEAHRMTSTAEGIAWEQRMLPMHNRFWPTVFDTCKAEALLAGIRKFRAVVVVDDSGKITDYLINPADGRLACFSKQMVGRVYPAPPTIPFYEIFSVELSSD